MFNPPNFNRKENIIIFSLLFLFWFKMSGQAIQSTLKISNLNSVSFNYRHDLGNKHSFFGGIKFHLNTNPEKDIFTIYVRDFNSFTFNQTVGFNLGYRFNLFSTKYMSSGINCEVSLFKLGMRNYKAGPWGVDSLTGNQLVSLDYVVIKESNKVIPIDIFFDMQLRISEDWRFISFVGFGFMMNEDFSNDQYRFYMSNTLFNDKWIYTFPLNFGFGISYNFKST